MAGFREIARVAWREGRFPKFWAFAVALPGVIKQLLEWFNVDVKRLSPYLPQPAWWWGFVILAVWALYVIYSMARRLLSYETPAIEIAPFRSAIDGSWWVDGVNIGGQVANSCVLSLRLENAQGERVFPQTFGLIGRPGAFPLRIRQPKHAQLASLREGRIVLHLLDGTTERFTRLEDERYTAVLSVYSETAAGHCEKRLTLSRESGTLDVS